MEDNIPASVDLLAYEWAEEVNRLTERFREQGMAFQVSSPFLRVCGNGFLPLVDKQMLQFGLQPQLRGGRREAHGALLFSLPESEEAQYLKYENEAKDVLLSVRFRLDHPNPLHGEVILRLATSWEFFCLVTGEAQTQ